MSPGFGRISFAVLLLGIIPPTKWRKRYLWTIITCQFIVDVVTVIISFSQCRPMRGFWDPNVHARCWSPSVQQRTGYFQGCGFQGARRMWEVYTDTLQLSVHWLTCYLLFFPRVCFGAFKWNWGWKFLFRSSWAWDCCEWTSFFNFSITHKSSAMVASIVKTVELRALTEKGDATRKLSSSLHSAMIHLTNVFKDAMAVLAIWWT
jgi:hypothetical protein